MMLWEQGFNFSAIAEKLKRSKSSISREFARNSNANGGYSANTAQKKYKKRKKNCGAKHKLQDEKIRKYVLKKLELHWTPEQISGRAKLEKQPFSISYNTIYRAVDSGVLPKETKKIMRFKSKNKKHKTADNRGKIPNTVNISERPAGAENRTRYGHWESDTVLGMRKTGCFGTHVERKSGFLIAFRLPDRQNDVFTKATIKAFKHVPDKLKKSFTVDNGREFTSHQELTAKTGMNVYFCDPYSAWQRGTNENTNGLLRQFFPKKTSFADVSEKDLQRVVNLTNFRPRKRLGFRTPYEILQKVLHLTWQSIIPDIKSAAYVQYKLSVSDLSDDEAHGVIKQLYHYLEAIKGTPEEPAAPIGAGEFITKQQISKAFGLIYELQGLDHEPSGASVKQRLAGIIKKVPGIDVNLRGERAARDPETGKTYYGRLHQL